ncbi:MAG: zinc-binding dehydrogenase [Bacillus subtilis]|nr:zinc-binding dehydrogenase [Bacillus subtilis]
MFLVTSAFIAKIKITLCAELLKSQTYSQGGFCEYIFVSSAHLENAVFKIDSQISDVRASFTEPAACCLRAIKRANVTVGDNVMIIGLGSIGLIMGQIASHYGARVYGCDLMDERLTLASDLGFDEVYKFTTLEETANKFLLKTHNIGADKVFLASGSQNSLSYALACVRDGGAIAVFSSVSSDEAGFPIIKFTIEN